jgi:hypothetical protein
MRWSVAWRWGEDEVGGWEEDGAGMGGRCSCVLGMLAYRGVQK